MPSNISPQPASGSATPSESGTASAWGRAREHLERLKAHIGEQINSYPSPIPACDAQFNYLLEQRGGISEELNKLEAARQTSLNREDGLPDEIGALEAFLDSSAFIDEAAARKIMAR